MVNRTRLSKFLSYVLRHDPAKYDLRPDKYGFVSITEVLHVLRKRFRNFKEEELFELTRDDTKGRFEVAGRKMRATYGHSYDVIPYALEEAPPEVLYHGTSRENAEIILKEGLRPMDRKYVHLSINTADAHAVGSRHDEDPVILRIMAAEAALAGIKFYREANVFLVEYVPQEFISSD
jgi:putative RNA 2'-phosphotransferase